MRIAFWECCGERHELMLSQRYPGREHYRFRCTKCGKCSRKVLDIARWYGYHRASGWVIQPSSTNARQSEDMATQGKVEWVGDDKFNKGNIRAKIDGEWYGADSDLADKVKAGYTIKFNYQEDGKNKIISAAKVIEKGAPPQKKQWGGGKGGGGNGRNQAYWDAKDKHQTEVVEPRITFVNARSHAIEAVGLLLTHGAVELGKEGEKRQEVILALIDTVTKRFADAAGSIGKPKAKKDEKPKAKDREEEDTDLEDDDDLSDKDDDLDDDEDLE